jgi:hypothetical protein
MEVFHFHTFHNEQQEAGWEVSLSLQIPDAIKYHHKLGIQKFT